MPCEHGQNLHDDYVRSVASRIAIEDYIESRFRSELVKARRMETIALAERSWHISRCSECWLDPPQSDSYLLVPRKSVA